MLLLVQTHDCLYTINVKNGRVVSTNKKHLSPSSSYLLLPVRLLAREQPDLYSFANQHVWGIVVVAAVTVFPVERSDDRRLDPDTAWWNELRKVRDVKELWLLHDPRKRLIRDHHLHITLLLYNKI